MEMLKLAFASTSQLF